MRGSNEFWYFLPVRGRGNTVARYVLPSVYQGVDRKWTRVCIFIFHPSVRTLTECPRTEYIIHRVWCMPHGTPVRLGLPGEQPKKVTPAIVPPFHASASAEQFKLECSELLAKLTGTGCPADRKAGRSLSPPSGSFRVCRSTDGKMDYTPSPVGFAETPQSYTEQCYGRR